MPSDLRAVSARASARAHARDLQLPDRGRRADWAHKQAQERSGLAVEPGGRDWPESWPVNVERITPIKAEAAVHLHTDLFRTADDLALALLIARHYPWPFLSRETMADALGASVASVDERLGKLRRLGLLRSYPSPISREDWLARDFGGKRSLRLLTIPELHWIEDMTHKKRCAHCGRFAPPGVSKRWTFCGATCRKEAHKKRCAMGNTPRKRTSSPTQTHEDK